MNTLKEDYPLWRRCQFQLKLFDWTMFPGDMTPKKWLFNIERGLIWPGKVVKEAIAPWGHRTQFYDIAKDAKSATAKVFWVYFSIRIVGIDCGFGLLYIPIPEETRKQYEKLANEKSSGQSVPQN